MNDPGVAVQTPRPRRLQGRDREGVSELTATKFTPDPAAVAELQERVAVVGAALTSILERLGPVAAAQRELEQRVEQLAENGPEESAAYYYMRLGGLLDATGLQHNRDLLRAIAALEEANDRDEPARRLDGWPSSALSARRAPSTSGLGGARPPA